MSKFDNPELYPQDASDLEWDVTFLNWRMSGEQALIDFECPGCQHMHEDISFIGWTALKCQGCGATLRREQNPWGPQVFRTLNDFWSHVLLWLVINKPCMGITGRIQAREFCHKFGACAEDFLWMHELDEANIDKYLSRLIP